MFLITKNYLYKYAINNTMETKPFIAKIRQQSQSLIITIPVEARKDNKLEVGKKYWFLPIKEVEKIELEQKHTDL